MVLYKIARTSKSRHVGKLYNDIVDAKNCKRIAGKGYHLYDLSGKVGFGQVKWVLKVK